MGAAKELWMAAVEATQDEYADGTLTREEAARELRTRGFDPDEIADMLDAIDEETGN